MHQKERIRNIVLEAIDDLNEQLPSDRQVGNSNETALFGKFGAVDSFGLVNLLVAIEERVDHEFGISIIIADLNMIAWDSNPFKSIGNLIDHVTSILGKRAINQAQKAS